MAPGPFQSGAIGARLLKALTLRHFEERDVVYTQPLTHNTAGFTQFTGDGVDHGKVADFSLTDFEATARSAVEPSFMVGSIKGEGLDLRQALTAMSEPSWRPGLPIGRIGVERASATGFNGAALKRYGISLDSITTETTHDGADVSRSTTRVDGFVVVPPARGLEGLQMRMAMLAMGLKELRLGLECSGREDRAKGELSVDSCALTGADLGRLDFSAKLVRMPMPSSGAPSKAATPRASTAPVPPSGRRSWCSPTRDWLKNRFARFRRQPPRARRQPAPTWPPRSGATSRRTS